MKNNSNPQDNQSSYEKAINDLINTSLERRLNASTEQLSNLALNNVAPLSEMQIRLIQEEENTREVNQRNFTTPQNEPMDFEIFDIDLDGLDGISKKNHKNPQL